MREILFRGKRSHNGEWVYGNLVVDAHGRSHIVPNAFFIEDGHHLRYEDDTDKPVFFNSKTLSQFTGLYDINGVRVFEGDIVKHYDDIGKVYWDEDACKFLIRDYNTGLPANLVLPCALHSSCTYEVIGNIYDNPELLKED